MSPMLGTWGSGLPGTGLQWGSQSLRQAIEVTLNLHLEYPPNLEAALGLQL